MTATKRSERSRRVRAEPYPARALGIAFGCAVGLSLGGTAARAGFVEPVPITDGSGVATQTAIGIDLANNAYISSVVGERIAVRIIGPGIDAETPMPPGSGIQGDPDFATNSRGVTYLCFSQLDPAAEVEGREIYLTQNDGGLFREPVRVTANRVDDYAPRLVLGRDGNPHLAWARRVGEETQVRYWNSEMAPGKDMLVGTGDDPALYADEEAVVHFAYTRANDVYYATYGSGGLAPERRITTTPFEPEISLSIGVDLDGTVLLSYQSKNSLYWVTKRAGGTFEPPALIARGGVLDPKMRVQRHRKVAIVYVKDGDVYYVQGQSSSLQPPERVTETPEVESRPSVEVDLSNNTHVSYIRDGVVWYTHNAETPEANFTAVPTTGEAPLTVRFADLSTGNVQFWEWDFGDGEISRAQHPSHVYQAPGKYQVTLTVRGPGAASSTKAVEDFVLVHHAYNTLRLPDQLVLPGQEDVWFPVIAGHKEPIQAFQLMGVYDPNLLVLERYELAYTVLQQVDPEFVVLNRDHTFFEFGCIFDYLDPFDKEPLPGGENQVLVNLVFDVSPDAPEGAETRLALVNNPLLSRILNIFTVMGQTRIPALKPSKVKILLVEPPYPRFFLRGDGNGDGKTDITDAVHILNFLFLGGLLTGCADGADATDDGKIDITDAISILNYLFLGGAPPAVPFPKPGLDPTDDALPPCRI
ncbi:MAG: PKD domain-containing protein [Planctomycetota bacterium]